MEKQKIILSGGTGFLGDSLIRYFKQSGLYEIIVISRKKATEKNGVKYLQWDGENLGEWADALENATALINLAGRTVNCRYTEKNKKEIFDSRLKSTAVLGLAIQQCAHPPKLWINSASATIYRHALDRPMDDETGEIGKGFSVEVCLAWEKTFNEIKTPHTRKIALRLAIVLGKNAGALTPLANLVKLGLGGTQGPGNQYLSWLHEEDFFRMLLFFMENKELEGTFNCSSPNPQPNKIFMKTLRKVMGIPFGMPQPVWLLELGARMIQTETELILKSRRVVPSALLKAGYQFAYPDLENALKEILNK